MVLRAICSHNPKAAALPTMIRRSTIHLPRARRFNVGKIRKVEFRECKKSWNIKLESRPSNNFSTCLFIAIVCVWRNILHHLRKHCHEHVKAFHLGHFISVVYITAKKRRKNAKFMEWPKYVHQFHIHINITSSIRILKRISSKLLFWMCVKRDCNRSRSLSSKFHLDSLKSNSDFLLCCWMICQERLGLWDARQRNTGCIYTASELHIPNCTISHNERKSNQIR